MYKWPIDFLGILWLVLIWAQHFLKSSWCNDKQSIYSASALLLKPFAQWLDSIAWKGTDWAMLLVYTEGFSRSSSLSCECFSSWSILYLLSLVLPLKLCIKYKSASWYITKTTLYFWQTATQRSDVMFLDCLSSLERDRLEFPPCQRPVPLWDINTG